MQNKIDTIDDKILDLLDERMALVRKADEEGRDQTGLTDFSRVFCASMELEDACIERLCQKSVNHLNPRMIDSVFREIFSVARNLEHPRKIAYLGPLASYTHQAALKQFGSASDFLPLYSINDVFESVQNKSAAYGVIPIENNAQGIVAQTLDCLAKFDLFIVAQTHLDIHHCLAARQNELEKIEKIYSKDIAIEQCRSFLRSYLLEKVQLVSVESTAKAARLCVDEPNSAAICSAVAAKLYKLPIVFEHIEDKKKNQTRFIIIGDCRSCKAPDSKTSILAATPHKPGALAKFLMNFELANINLLKIESRPQQDADDFSTWFYIEFEGYFTEEQVRGLLQKHTSNIKWLGSYPNTAPESEQT